MRILITGGAGYIGSHMVLNLLDHGHFVAIVDDLSTGDLRLVDKRASFTRTCISDSKRISDLIREMRIDTIMHFAASISIPDSIRQPMHYYENNVVHACTLLQTAIECGIKNFVFSSTAAVYGPGNEPIIPEDGSLKPVSPYGRSKLMFEKILEDAATAHNVAYAIIRYFNVAGADPDGRSGRHSKQASNLISAVCEAVETTEKKVIIFGNDYDTPDGTCIRDFIHVQDLVEAHRLALEKISTSREILSINCGTGQGTSVREVIKAVEQVSGERLQVSIDKRRRGDLPVVLADNTKIRTLLGWEPKYPDINTIICHELNWLHKRKQAEKAS